MDVTPIYLGGKAPRLGIVNEGADIGTLAVHTGSEWELIVDLRKYGHLITEVQSENNEPESVQHAIKRALDGDGDDS